MSGKATDRAPGILAVAAKPGAETQITDGSGRDVWRGSEPAELTVAPGLYAVKWLSLGSREQSLVEVLPGSRVPVEPTERPVSIARDEAAAAVIDVPMVVELLHSTRRWDNSDLVVTVETPSSASTSEPTGPALDAILASVSLIAGADREIASSPDPKLRSKVGARSWGEVTSGRYRLRYRATSGDLLDQTIPVFAGRRTVVRLFVSEATLVVPDGERFTNIRTVGVDPARSVIATIHPRRSREELDEGLRLAELLLRDLARGTGSLSDAFVIKLDDPRTDPLLRVYGAMVVINCLERNVAPALDQPIPDGERRVREYRKRWLKVARRWLTNPRRGGMPPDATAGLWQIEQMGLANDEASARAPRSIKTPPMLDCAWRWAIARSSADRQALQGFASIRAAARSAGGTAPFLCWQASAAKAINHPGTSPSTKSLDALVEQIAAKMHDLRMRDPGRTPRPMLPNGVPAEAGAVALRAEDLVAERELKGADRSSSLAAELATSLAFPLAALGVRLEQTMALLDHGLTRDVESFVQSPRAHDRDAPGWKAKIRHKDDPNLGRFGGCSAQQGFELSARFEKAKSSKNWIAIHLQIRGPAKDGDQAVFYLHDSFRPMRREIAFAGRAARLKVTAWGGFTVGAWIPSRGIELELNLAELETAPRIIRER